MPLNNYQNFLFDDATASVPTGLAPIVFMDDAVTFTFSPSVPGFSFLSTANNPATDPGGTAPAAAALVGPSQVEGLLISAITGFGATLAVSGGTLSGGTSAAVGGTIFVGVGGGMHTIFPGWTAALMTAGGTLAGVSIAPGPLGTVTLIDPAGVSVTGIKFTNTLGFPAPLFINGITANATCYCAGTAIATPDGPRAVETLVAGDIINTADGGKTTVRWLGEQPIATRFLHPAKINPICIRAGALGEGVPSRDLFVSQDHAIAIDGLLINAGALVNGTSIYQVKDMPLDGFSYYHVETDAHELILAEGCAAESFIDYAGRDGFINGEESDTVIAEMDLPRISAARLVPQAVRDRLAGERKVA